MKVLLRSLPFLACCCLFTAPLRGDDTKTKPTPFIDKPLPENVEDLKAIQERVKEVLKKVVPATVGLQVGGASGSGVIIDKEGHVLTAGHVSGAADRSVTIILPDGTRLKGKTLGGNRGIDSGLIKITQEGNYPFVEMGKSSDLKRGQWVIATGHPGGFRPGRTPVVRLGRMLESKSDRLRTDCTLVGGDSGGPLFDLDGKVVGIHSSIGGQITINNHVPVDTYRETWDRLAKGEVWGGGFFGGGSPADVPYLGVENDPDAPNYKITKVRPNSPAEKAGLKEDDVILSFDGKAIATFEDLAGQIGKKKVGDTVTLMVERGKEKLKIEVKLGKRSN